MSFYAYIFVRYKTKTLLRSTWKLGVFEALRLYFDVTIRLAFLSTENLKYSVSHLFMMHTGDKNYVNVCVLCRVNFFRFSSWHWDRLFQRKRQLERRCFFKTKPWNHARSMHQSPQITASMTCQCVMSTAVMSTSCFDAVLTVSNFKHCSKNKEEHQRNYLFIYCLFISCFFTNKFRVTRGRLPTIVANK